MGKETPQITYEVEESEEYECDIVQYRCNGSPVLPNGLPSFVGIDRMSGRKVLVGWLNERGELHREGLHAFEHFGDYVCGPHRKWFRNGELIGSQRPEKILDMPFHIAASEHSYMPDHVMVAYGEEIEPPSLELDEHSVQNFAPYEPI